MARKPLSSALTIWKTNPFSFFAPGGFVYVLDNVAGVTWENEVDGATNIGTYHERTVNPNELAFRAINVGSQTRTIEWATVALNHAP